MPVSQCSNGKWKIGSGECQYDTKEKATEVWQAIIASGQYGKTKTNGKANNTESNIRKAQGRETSEESQQTQS